MNSWALRQTYLLFLSIRFYQLSEKQSGIRSYSSRTLDRWWNTILQKRDLFFKRIVASTSTDSHDLKNTSAVALSYISIVLTACRQVDFAYGTLYLWVSTTYWSGKLRSRHSTHLDTPTPALVKEYVMICTEVGCDPTRGLDFRGFSRMVDDEEGRPVLNCVGKWRTGSRLHQNTWNWGNHSIYVWLSWLKRKLLRMWKLAPALEDVCAT